MSYYVRAINCNAKTAQVILHNIKKRRSCAQPMKNSQIDSAVLSKCFQNICNVIARHFPEIRRKRILLYLFDESEGKRRKCGGMCSKFDDGTYSIGICVSALSNEEKLKYYLFHEIAHLKYFEHSQRFYETLDFFRAIYSLHNNEPMVNIYEDREKAIYTWNSRRKASEQKK